MLLNLIVYFDLPISETCVADPRRGVLPAQGGRLRGAVPELHSVAGAPHQEDQDAQGAAILPQEHVRQASDNLWMFLQLGIQCFPLIVTVLGPAKSVTITDCHKIR